MPASKKKPQCYIYTRVSTQMQVEKYSLDAQRERLCREADHRGMTIAAEFSDACIILEPSQEVLAQQGFPVWFYFYRPLNGPVRRVITGCAGS